MTLNNSEWTIMEKLWEQPYTMMQLYHILEEETGWSKSTVVTMLGRMVDKGLAGILSVSKERGCGIVRDKESD